MDGRFLARRNAQVARLSDVPLVDQPVFRESVLDAVLAAGCRIASLFARQAGDSNELVAVVASDASSELGLIRTRVIGDAFESLTPECPQAHLFEREIAEQFGIL